MKGDWLKYMYSWRERHMNMAKKYTFTFLPTGSFNYTLARTSSDICLNPRIHMGCDTDAQHMNVIFEAMFQSTHPHRMRRLKTTVYLAYNSFNPRTHIGYDKLLVCSMTLPRSFTPRTHIGCDSLAILVATEFVVSIHAPT